MRRILLAVFAAAVLGTFAVGAAAAPGTTARHTASQAPRATAQITPILRYRFPSRGYVIDLPRAVAISSHGVSLTENGRGIGNFTLAPLTSSGLSLGVMLAIDASDSMTGKPLAGALAAAQSFVARRGQNEDVGVVAFNNTVKTLQLPTAVAGDVQRAFSHSPAVAYGTHIFDAVDRSLALLQQARVSTGAIVLISDGADVGSSISLAQAVAKAEQQHVRVFTVGLRSRAYDPRTLRSLATQTGGSYAEATSPARLAQIYGGLSTRLASDYVLQYRSLAAPRSHVEVAVSVRGFASATTAYTAPTPSGLAPYHRSLVTRFLLSSGSLLILALLIAALVAYAIRALLARGRTGLVERVHAFAAEDAPLRSVRESRVRRRRTPARSVYALRWLGSVERDLDIGQINLSVRALIGLTIGATLLLMIVLALIAPVFVVLGLLVPFVSRSLVKRQLKRVRDRFATQLPTNIQILASALRSGHGFAGALAVVIENAEEPAHRELRRAVADEQLGVPLEEALRRVAERMQSRDLDQVALVAELQHTTGGNIAEVLDVVVATIREREDVRRLVRTLTAQGRMARWILTALPIVVGAAFYAIQPGLVGPMYRHTGGQIAVVFAALMVAAGSLVIQKIIEVEV